MNKIYLFLLTLFAAVGFNANAAAPSTLYVHHWGNNGSPAATFTQDASNPNVFTCEYKVNNGQFEISANSNGGGDYWRANGNTDNDRHLKFGTTYTLKKSSNETFLCEGHFDVNNGDTIYLRVTFDGDNATMEVAKDPFTSGGGGETTTVPSALYLIGDIDGVDGWNADRISMTKSGSVFTASNVTFSGNRNFRFSTESSAGWSGYGASSDGTTAALLPSTNTISSSTQNNWNAPAASTAYDIVADFSVSPAVMKISVHQGVVNPPTPTGSDMYVWFGSYWSTPNAMTAEGDWWTYDYTATAKGTLFFNFSDANNPGSDGYWDDDAFDSHRIGHTGNANASISPNGSSLSAGTNSGKPYALTLTADWTYKIMISKSSPYTVKVTTENVEEDLDLDNKDTTKYWYLSGDINTWSSIIENNKRVPGNYFYGEDAYSGSDTEAKTGTDPQNNGYQVPTWRSGADTFNYRPEAGEDYKKFLSVREMNQMFRFRPVTQADVDALGSYTDVDGSRIAANSGTNRNSGWWVLDLTNAKDLDGNPARLCGQFKIINGSLTDNDNNYAYGGTDAAAEGEGNLNNALQVNVMRGDAKLGQDNNLTIAPTVVEKAKIFFRVAGDHAEIMVTGEAHDLYLYYVDYGHDNATSTAPSKGKIGNDDAYFSAGKQLNYRSRSEETWTETTLGDVIDDLPEALDILKSQTSLKVFKMRIHPSMIHRSPMPFTAAITSYKGTRFAPVSLHCDNEWFAEGDPVNLYLRYEDETLTPEAMYCNTYYNRYENGEMVGVRYQHKEYEKMADPQNYDDEIPAAYRGYDWFKSGDVTTYFANGGYALFASSRGEMYPLGGINAIGTERARVALNGVDLFYVIPTSVKLNILYNHLNGTFNISDKDIHNNKIQINAELFQESHPLFGDHIDFTMDGSVTYRFRVYHLNESEELVKVADSDVIAQPFYDWDVTGCGVGYYQVLVIATRGGKTYQAYDVYSIAE